MGKNIILQVPDDLRPSFDTTGGEWRWEHLPTRSAAVTVHNEIGGQIGGEQEDWPVEYVCLIDPTDTPWIVMRFDQGGLDDVLIRGMTSRERPGDGHRWIAPEQFGEFRDILIHARRFLYPRFLAGDMTTSPADGMTLVPYGGVIYTKDGVLHREDGPAYMETYRWEGATESNEAFFIDGEMHRDGDLPAYRSADTNYHWMKHGLPHRIGGPALIRKFGRNVFGGKTFEEGWYLDGIKQIPSAP